MKFSMNTRMSSLPRRARLVVTLMGGALLQACSHGGSTAAFSTALLRHVTDSGVELNGDRLELGRPKEELPPWCNPFSKRTLSCAHVSLAKPWEVGIWPDGHVRTIVLWSIQGPSDFICRLYTSMDSDFRQQVGQPRSAVPCTCGNHGCEDRRASSREWRLGEKVELGLDTVTHAEAPHAPDGTPISTLIVTVSQAFESQ